MSARTEMRLGGLVFAFGLIVAVIPALSAVVFAEDPAGGWGVGFGLILMVVGVVLAFHGDRVDRANLMRDWPDQSAIASSNSESES